MGMVMAVSFTRYGRLYYLDPGTHQPRVGDKVLVPTDSGPEVAECVWAPEWSSDDIGGLPVCEGLATDAHLARDELNRERKAEARSIAKRLVRQHELPMKVTAVDLVDQDAMGSTTYVIYFTAPQRVDFRGLVRDLAGTLRARVDLRQLSARDDAKVQGGIGPCGRDLCCATFLQDFEPVSVRMAKDQDLGVNPMRISGACGRLMCCLKYEHPLYQEFKASAPAVGSTVTTPEGDGRVVAHQVPKDSVLVRVSSSGRVCSCSRASVCSPRKAYETRDPVGVSTGEGSGSVEVDGTTTPDSTRAPLAGAGTSAGAGTRGSPVIRATSEGASVGDGAPGSPDLGATSASTTPAGTSATVDPTDPGPDDAARSDPGQSADAVDTAGSPSRRTRRRVRGERGPSDGAVTDEPTPGSGTGASTGSTTPLRRSAPPHGTTDDREGDPDFPSGDDLPDDESGWRG